MNVEGDEEVIWESSGSLYRLALTRRRGIQGGK